VAPRVIVTGFLSYSGVWLPASFSRQLVLPGFSPQQPPVSQRISADPQIASSTHNYESLIGVSQHMRLSLEIHINGGTLGLAPPCDVIPRSIYLDHPGCWLFSPPATHKLAILSTFFGTLLTKRFNRAKQNGGTSGQPPARLESFA